MYCAAWNGGTYNDGCVFALNLFPSPIPLTLKLADHAAILSWSNPAFSLYAAPTVTGTYTNILNTASPYTNPVAGPQEFFRLQAN
jgi:hypothetical protein